MAYLRYCGLVKSQLVRTVRGSKGIMALTGFIMILVAAGCSQSGPSPYGRTGSYQISMVKSYRFEPSTVEVPLGTTVTWVNNDDVSHSVRFTKGADYQSKALRPGEAASYTFSVPREYEYECGVHGQIMKGKVIVQGSGPPSY